MICFMQGGYKNPSQSYHKGQGKETKTLLEPALLALESGLSSDVFSAL